MLQIGLIILFAGILPHLHAQTQEDLSENFREQCRKYVSGMMATQWSEQGRSRDAVKLANRALGGLKPRRDKAANELDALQQGERKQPSFDSRLLEKRDALRAEVKLLEEQISLQESIARKAEITAQDAAKNYRMLTAQVEKIFNLNFKDDPEGLPRKIFYELTWKSPCPKYRTLCPLPPAEAKTLKIIAEMTGDQSHTESCLRYSNLK